MVFLGTCCGVAFEDKRFGDREEFAALKSKGAFPFGSVPVLHIEESDITTTIAQSPAIMRYAGKLCGMYPDDPVAAALVDQVSDTIVCLARGRCRCRACTTSSASARSASTRSANRSASSPSAISFSAATAAA